ncbi:20 kDa chaperonin, putative [Plasmodium vivax]|uniref:20 kDa chaperonin, chloroplastic n=6 Tax=Plasmodium vivax TaxID=5855 RepID=A5K7X6_PLAVS|nr:chaperonin, putative [Plasmodium vivax]KMZ79335.1 chaperonin [Plasmodium vivax India VII]KMZ85477.1 chaperonin [Plasmodium vivax Brazil I]KMZ91353.1 chaperonin [Plasmodium vivax Mauritania I]KMZ98192.1 chaperonin [Plasmodium vivax North Korean]EDL44390.1 chaperonin, putative [Plasmodium vivax]|eukprot:XP_001614117.1 chaperonin [Plasmodium vivax Sal-1]
MKLSLLASLVVVSLTAALAKRVTTSSNLNFVTSNPRQLQRSSSQRLRATEYKLENKIIRGPLTPLNEFVLIQKDEAYDTTEAGVFIGDTLRKNQYIGKILGVGTGAVNTKNGERVPIDVQVGDVVIFNPSDGTKLKYNDKECLLISNEEILAKINDASVEVRPNNITPFYDRVLIKLVDTNAASSSLVIMPESKSDKSTDGLVVAVGDGTYDSNNNKVPIDVRVNDYIKFSPFSNESCEFTYNGEKFTFVRARYIMAKY